MATGLILTMGLSPEPLVFSIKELKADYVYFIGTPTSFKKSLDRTVELAGLRPSQFDKKEIAESPESIGELCEKFQTAFNDLKKKGIDTVITDPTGGRKWMSAGAVMIASFLGIPMFYVDANYVDGHINEESMQLVELGNAYDQTGFILTQKAVDYFNQFNFGGAATQFSFIKLQSAHKKALYSGLEKLSFCLARWDRFEHYSSEISNELNEACESIDSALKAGISINGLNEFLYEIRIFSTHLSEIEGQEKLDINFITDMYLNAERCIERKRYDDAVARLYRTLESVSQYLLYREFKFDCSDPNYSILDDTSKTELTKNFQDNILPEKVGLLQGFWLLNVLGNELGKYVFPKREYKNFIFTSVLNYRNLSILAHGFKPVTEKEARKFSQKLKELLELTFAKEFDETVEKLLIPKLPQMGF